MPTASSARGSRTHSSHTVCASTQNNVVTWESVLGSDEFQRSGGRESVRMNRWVRIMALLDRAGQINHCVLSCSRNPTVQEVARSERKQTQDLCDKRGTKRWLIGFKCCFLHLKVFFLIIHKLVLVSFFLLLFSTAFWHYFDLWHHASIYKTTLSPMRLLPVSHTYTHQPSSLVPTELSSEFSATQPRASLKHAKAW